MAKIAGTLSTGNGFPIRKPVKKSLQASPPLTC